jgi:hypothetical protein
VCGALALYNMVRKEDRFSDDFEDDLQIRRNLDRQAELSKTKPRSKRGRRYAEETSTHKAPMVFRIIAWVAIVFLFFGVGYWGTSFTLDLLNKKNLVNQSDVVENQQELSEFLAADSTVGRKVTFPIYIPIDGNIVKKDAVVVSSIMEDDMKRLIAKLFEECGDPLRGVSVQHVFRNGDTAYLNVNNAFMASLNALGEQTSTLLITGIVQTVKESFSPVAKVRFLVEGKVPQSGAPVNLSVPWEIRS